MNLKEALTQAFGKSADLIDLSRVQPWVEMEVTPLALMIEQGGGLFVSCGGRAIAHMATVSKNTSICFYLTIDNTAHNAFQCERRRAEKLNSEGRGSEVDWDRYHSACPREVLTVVASS